VATNSSNGQTCAELVAAAQRADITSTAIRSVGRFLVNSWKAR